METALMNNWKSMETFTDRLRSNLVKMLNKGKNLKVVGHPQLDYFYLGQDKNLTNKNYVIYAPHWSINVPEENYATFEWNGEFLLEYAKKRNVHKKVRERIGVWL